MVGSSNRHGDGYSWIRGPMIGKGSSGYVFRAIPRNPGSKFGCFPSVMAVKSAEVSVSGLIQKEREILSNLQSCPYIIECFGEETTTGDCGLIYNLLLEFGSGGSLADRIKKSGRGLDEIEVKLHTKSLLTGLNHIHSNGYVHCDLKPHNVLLIQRIQGSNFKAKICDFGLAKRAGKSLHWRGTPMYLSPEAVIDNNQESAADIWALGCIVLEMLTGEPPWNTKSEEVLGRIRTPRMLPKIPKDLSKEAKEFLKCCLSRNPKKRLSCEMLLKHSFVKNIVEEDSFGEDEVSDEFVDDSLWEKTGACVANHEFIFSSIEDMESRVGGGIRGLQWNPSFKRRRFQPLYQAISAGI